MSGCDCGGCRQCLIDQGVNTDDESDDNTADLIADIRGWIDDAELAHELGNDDKARHCLREAMALLEDTLEAA